MLRFWMIIGLLMLIFPFKSSGQQARLSPNYDSITYQQYLSSDWKALLQTGKSMLKQKQDYYYLRMRMGIAAMEIRNYSLAEHHFRKALEFNPYSQDALLFLFQTLRNNYRQLEAGALTGSLSEASRNQLQLPKSAKLHSLHIDVGYNRRSNTEGLEFEKLTYGFGQYGYERVYRNNWFTDGGAFVLARPDLMLYAGIQLIDVEVIDRFAYLVPELGLLETSQNEFGKAFYYRLESKPSMKEQAHKLTQRAVYLQLQYSPATKLRIVGNLTLQGVKSDFTVSEETTVSLSDTAFVNSLSNEVQMFTANYNALTFNTVTWTNTDFNAGINSILSIGKFQPSAGVSLGRINSIKTLQINTGLSYLPFGNAGLYLRAELFNVIHSNANHFAAKGKMGAKLFSRTWLEAEFLAGNLNNLSDQYGYILFNHPEKLRSRSEVVFSFELSPELLFQLRYKLLFSERQYYSLNPETTEIENYKYPIDTQTITGGLKWHF